MFLCLSDRRSLALHINIGDLDSREMSSSVSTDCSTCSASKKQPLFNLEDNQKIFELPKKLICIIPNYPGRLSAVEYCLLFRSLGKGVACCKYCLGRSPIKDQCQEFPSDLVVSLDPWVHLLSRGQNFERLWYYLRQQINLC